VRVRRATGVNNCLSVQTEMTRKKLRPRIEGCAPSRSARRTSHRRTAHGPYMVILSATTVVSSLGGKPARCSSTA
jgi:hypothetical protein